MLLVTYNVQGFNIMDAYGLGLFDPSLSVIFF